MIRKLKNTAHFGLALLANLRYQFPSRKLTVIGVTGTDGKTTTTSLIYHILKENGKKVAAITTVGAYIGDKVYETGLHTTTPSPFLLQQYIKKVLAAKCEYLILETTSHALDQNRVAGINFQVGVLTNITHEHLDYHKTYANYVKAKAKLLQRSKVAILNYDDESYKHVVKLLKGVTIRRYSLLQKADLNLRKFPFQTKLLGDFNKQNCLAAALAVREVGIPEAGIKKAIASFEPPLGRQEIVFDKEFKVIVDFAHTPNSLEKILPEVRKETKGRLIHVFGSAGQRDATKRPKMGEASSKYADIIVLTAEDPRRESIEEINKQIARGFSKDIKKLTGDDMPEKGKWYVSIPRREKAVAFALKLAKKGDTVILTGKGHEQSMNYGSGEEEWNEKREVEKYLSSL